jgi:hypothetical protein
VPSIARLPTGGFKVTTTTTNRQAGRIRFQVYDADGGLVGEASPLALGAGKTVSASFPGITWTSMRFSFLFLEQTYNMALLLNQGTLYGYGNAGPPSVPGISIADTRNANGQVRVTWTASTTPKPLAPKTVMQYRVYVNGVLKTTTPGYSYIFSNADPAGSYQIYVVAFYADYWTTPSSTAYLYSVVPPAPPPPPPSQPVLTVTDLGGDIQFSWAPTLNTSAYYMYRQVSGATAFSKVADLAASATTLADTTRPARPVNYYLRAYGPGGSTASATVVVQKLPILSVGMLQG